MSSISEVINIVGIVTNCGRARVAIKIKQKKRSMEKSTEISDNNVNINVTAAALLNVGEILYFIYFFRMLTYVVSLKFTNGTT